MTPTYETTSSFQRDFAGLDETQRRRFRKAVQQFVDDLAEPRLPRPGLRVIRIQGAPMIREITWAPDGRATFQRGSEIRPGEAHIIWRRIGTHDILTRP